MQAKLVFHVFEYTAEDMALLNRFFSEPLELTIEITKKTEGTKQ